MKRLLMERGMKDRLGRGQRTGHHHYRDMGEDDHDRGGRGKGHGKGRGEERGEKHGRGSQYDDRECEGSGRGHHGDQGRGHSKGRGRGQMHQVRRISSDELQLIVLSLLKEDALHGYQMIKELESRTKGFYKPSPGVIYPLLAYLEESDLTAAIADGSKKKYQLTATGLDFLEANNEAAAKIVGWLQSQGELIEAMENAYEAEREVINSPLRTHVHELRHLLRSQQWNDAQTAEITQILEMAIQKIKLL